MPIKDIVLHQGVDSRSSARLEAAVTLAKLHDARITCVFPRPDPNVPNVWMAPLGEKGVNEMRATIKRSAAEAETAFRTRIAEEGLAGEWRDMTGLPTEVMVTCSRYGDLTVVSQTDPDEPPVDAAMADHVVLGAGGPVLVVPYAGEFTSIGRRVMVAWNGTRESARAVHDAMPLLKKAETVIVYGVNPEDDGHLASAEISAHLARHGVKVEAEHGVFGSESDAVAPALTTVGGSGFRAPGAWSRTRHAAVGEIGVGEALLSAVSDEAIDLLVMGAYGHSRIRELVLGGATREVLKSMTVPVLMSN